MLDSFPIAVAVGIALGYFAGIGIGGGSLLILWLTLALDMPQGIARSVNLMFFLACAAAVSLFRWKQGKLNLKKILPAILSGCLFAGIFSWLSTQLDVGNLKKLFGMLLLVTGVRELFYRPRELR